MLLFVADPESIAELPEERWIIIEEWRIGNIISVEVHIPRFRMSGKSATSKNDFLLIPAVVHLVVMMEIHFKRGDEFAEFVFVAAVERLRRLEFIFSD